MGWGETHARPQYRVRVSDGRNGAVSLSGPGSFAESVERVNRRLAKAAHRRGLPAARIAVWGDGAGDAQVEVAFDGVSYEVVPDDVGSGIAN